MQCPKCAYDNDPSNKFCGNCGTKLVLLCPSCANENPADHKFCGKCGTTLQGTANQPTVGTRETRSHSVRRGTSGSESEVRHLTIMFCDLVDSTALSSSRDAEEFRLLVQEYQSTCEQVISQYNGYIAQYLGDGLLIYFGYPIAHEDDAMRAVHSGLGILESMKELNNRLLTEKNVKLEVRIGVHSGMVVVGDVGVGKRSERLALGETTNIAARIEGIAAKGTMAISQSTLQLVHGFFNSNELGIHTLKGISKPVKLYQVIAGISAQSRFDVAGEKGLTPFVGRQLEINLLLARWEEARMSHSRVVLLTGGAGVGKSRLIRELTLKVSSDKDVRIIQCYCSPYHQNSAFHPVIDMMDREIFNVEPGRLTERELNHIEAFVRQNNMPLEQVVPLFASLFSIPLSNKYAPLPLTPEKMKQRTVEALMSALLNSALKQPLLLIIEDLHWMDASTLELINLILKQSPTHRILTLLTFRPEFIPPWGVQPHFATISLAHLRPSESRKVVLQIAQSMILPDEVIERIIKKTDGIPLFVEELTKSVIESRQSDGSLDLVGSTGAETLAIPETLHDALIARLDRLGDDREIAQLYAAIGREFSYELCDALGDGDKNNLEDGLAHLVSSGMLDQHGVPPTATYQFKHALVQDAAYQSLIKSKRYEYHARIANVLVEKFADRFETRPEMIAHQYTEAGLIDKAVNYWYKAGARSMGRYENIETIAHLSRGLELLTSLPESLARDEQELDFRVALGPALMVIRGYGSIEVRNVFTIARTLSIKLGRKTEIGQILWGLAVNCVVNAEYQSALEYSGEQLKVGKATSNRSETICAHLSIGGAHFGLADFAQASKHFELGSKLYSRDQHEQQVAFYGMDLGIFCLAFGTHSSWHLGDNSITIESRNEAISLCEKLDHSFSWALTYDYSSILHQFRREPDLVLQYAEAAKVICEENKFGYYLGWATILAGWALASLKDPDKGISEIKKGLNIIKGTDGKRSIPYYTTLLAEAYWLNGQIEAGLKTIVEAMDLASEIGEPWWKAEMHRLKGEMLLSASEDNVTEAESLFKIALNIARDQKSKALELRVSTSLSRLWHDAGKSNNAKELLSQCIETHTEGFDMPDYKDATGLLQELCMNA